MIISDNQAETCLIITINDTSIKDLPLIITISDTCKNQPKRLDSDNTINLSSLIVSLARGHPRRDRPCSTGEDLETLDRRKIVLQVKPSRASSPSSRLFCRSRGIEGIHTEATDLVLQVKISRASSPTSSVFCRSRGLEGIHAEATDLVL